MECPLREISSPSTSYQLETAEYFLPRLADGDLSTWCLHTKKRLTMEALSRCLYGAGTRNRTTDLLITNQLLYQLSYAGLMGPIIA